jgi:(2Fe-2S) ferredoxin
MEDRTAEVRERGFTDHVLVCTTDRDDHACCGDAGGEAVFDAVVDWLRERDVLWSRVYVAETGCLGLCSEGGAAVAIQPRNRWYSDVTSDDVSELLADEFGAEASRLGVAPGAVSGRRSD